LDVTSTTLSPCPSLGFEVPSNVASVDDVEWAAVDEVLFGSTASLSWPLIDEMLFGSCIPALGGCVPMLADAVEPVLVDEARVDHHIRSAVIEIVVLVGLLAAAYLWWRTSVRTNGDTVRAVVGAHIGSLTD